MVCSVTVLVGLIFLGGKLNVHHTILRTALAPHCSKIIEMTGKTVITTTGLPYLEKHRTISRKLFDIYLELSSDASHQKPGSPKLLLKLKGIIGELDPAYTLSQDNEPTEPDKVNTSEVLDVCPEKYMGEKYGYPFYHKGWEMQNCTNVKPLDKVCSIYLYTYSAVIERVECRFVSFTIDL